MWKDKVLVVSGKWLEVRTHKKKHDVTLETWKIGGFKMAMRLYDHMIRRKQRKYIKINHMISGPHPL